MATTIFPIIPLLIVGGIIAIVIAVLVLGSSKVKPLKRYHSHGRQIYVSGEFSQQMELDLRLPYRRFKKLYPTSNLTYDEYKKLQRQRAFRRSLSSEQNHRMVR